MTTGNAALPTGWVPTSLGEVAHVEAGQSPSSSSFTADETAIAFLQGERRVRRNVPDPGETDYGTLQIRIR